MRPLTVILAIILGVAAPAAAGDLYESWSPVDRAPAGKLTKASARKLPQWLEVTPRAGGYTVVFHPEKRIRWLVEQGPKGPLSKTTTVDGQPWTKTVFTYDVHGNVATKKVTGPGVKGPLVFEYSHGPGGTTRTRKRDAGKMIDDVWTLKEERTGTWVATTSIDGKPVRRDTFDDWGRRLLVSTTGDRPIELIYERDTNGRLKRVRRRIDGRLEPAATRRPRRKRSGTHLREINGAFERHEVLMLIGAPITHSRDGQGAARIVKDNYTDDCWLNEPSEITYDAADKVVGSHAACICGFCVLAKPTPVGHTLGVDEHWTRGPWVDLDGTIVTADHMVATPTGPRPAADLKVGDRVLNSKGMPKALTRAAKLPVGELRLGSNLRTSSGLFTAGDLTLHSEQPCRER